MVDLVHVSTLKRSGLPVVLVPLGGVSSVSVIALTSLGSRYEDFLTSGLAHFYEHLVHDGTEKYPSSLILSEIIEEVGADSNAMTSEDYTGYYVKVESRHLDLALDSISQIMLHPLLLESEIEREKGIIIEEIHMREDTPQIKVYDQLMQLLFAGDGLGLPGAGTEKTVNSFQRQQLLDLKNKYYVASNMVLVVSGDLGDIEKLNGRIEYYFGDIERGKKIDHNCYNPLPIISPLEIIKKHTDQVHLAMGWRGFSRYDQKRYPQALLSIILGGGFSSRLIQKIRQELSLAYAIYTDVDLFNDVGVFTIGAGLDKSRTAVAIEAILKELHMIANSEKLVSDKELRKVKDYLRGKMALQLEDSLRLGMYYGLQQLLEGQIRVVSETMEKIESVTSDQIHSVALDIFKEENLMTVLIADGLSHSEFDKILLKK